MWGDSLWQLRLKTRWVNLWVPVPLYVIGDLMRSMEDLGAVILPRLNLPNYPAEVRTVLQALLEAGGGETIVEVDADDVRIVLRPWEEGRE